MKHALNSRFLTYGAPEMKNISHKPKTQLIDWFIFLWQYDQGVKLKCWGYVMLLVILVASHIWIWQIVIPTLEKMMDSENLAT